MKPLHVVVEIAEVAVLHDDPERLAAVVVVEHLDDVLVRRDVLEVLDLFQRYRALHVVTDDTLLDGHHLLRVTMFTTIYRAKTSLSFDIGFIDVKFTDPEYFLGGHFDCYV